VLPLAGWRRELFGSERAAPVEGTQTRPVRVGGQRAAPGSAANQQRINHFGARFEPAAGEAAGR